MQDFCPPQPNNFNQDLFYFRIFVPFLKLHTMFVNTSKRSTEPEIMDDFSMEGDYLQQSLERLDWINKWLGGNQVTIDGFKQLLKGIPKDRKIRIVDIGCGSGDVLRRVAQYLREAGRNAELTGIDANPFTIKYARQQSTAYPEISYRCLTIPCREFDALEYDVLTATLFLHHFDHNELVSLLKNNGKKAKIGIVVNDLHRNKIAYSLFWLLTLVVGNRMIREDGLTSILRGFKKPDLIDYCNKLGFKNYMIKWRWAFRYQWTIQLNDSK